MHFYFQFNRFSTYSLDNYWLPISSYLLFPLFQHTGFLAPWNLQMCMVYRHAQRQPNIGFRIQIPTLACSFIDYNSHVSIAKRSPIQVLLFYSWFTIFFASFWHFLLFFGKISPIKWMGLFNDHHFQKLQIELQIHAQTILPSKIWPGLANKDRKRRKQKHKTWNVRLLSFCQWGWFIYADEIHNQWKNTRDFGKASILHPSN